MPLSPPDGPRADDASNPVVQAFVDALKILIIGFIAWQFVELAVGPISVDSVGLVLPAVAGAGVLVGCLVGYHVGGYVERRRRRS